MSSQPVRPPSMAAPVVPVVPVPVVPVPDAKKQRVKRAPAIRHPLTKPSPHMIARMTQAQLANLHDFKVPKISSFELEDGRSFYAAFTVSRKAFGTLEQCKIMQQLLYSILYSVGIRNEEISTSPHDPLTRLDLRELPSIGGISAQAWLLSKARWRLKILSQRLDAKAQGTAGVGTGAGGEVSLPKTKAATSKGCNRTIPQKIDPSLMRHVWQEIVFATEPLVSKRDLELLNQQQYKSSRATGPRPRKKTKKTEAKKAQEGITAKTKRNTQNDTQKEKAASATGAKPAAEAANRPNLALSAKADSVHIIKAQSGEINNSKILSPMAVAPGAGVAAVQNKVVIGREMLSSAPVKALRPAPNVRLTAAPKAQTTRPKSGLVLMWTSKHGWARVHASNPSSVLKRPSVTSPVSNPTAKRHRGPALFLCEQRAESTSIPGGITGHAQ